MKKKFLFLIVALIFIGFSCTKYEYQPIPSENVYNTEGIPDGMMKLGRKLENPYSLSNMKRAFRQIPHLKSAAEDLQPTHLYVRFLPATTEEMTILTEDSLLKLYDHPFDYEIIRDGQFYHDPSIPLDRITWLYTVVEPDYEFPDVQYEILEELYLPDESEAEAELKSLALTGNLPDDVNLKSMLKRRYRPSGQVLVQDNSSNTERGLSNVQVRLRNWFRIDEVYTNASGSFTAEENFRGRVDVKVIFRNQRFRMRSTLVHLFDNIDYRIASEVRGINLVISREDREGSAPPGWGWKKNNRLWAYATIWNALEFYHQYCITHGVGTPPYKLRIWANSVRGEPDYGGSAPMFTRGFRYYTLNWDRWWKFAANRLYIPATNIIMNVFRWFLPDVIINFNRITPANSNRLSEVVFHELAHASHFNMVGPGFWSHYVNAIVNNYVDGKGSYGDGLGKHADLVAISEAWGWYMGWYLSLLKYPENAIMPLSLIEDFVPGQKGGVGIGWIQDFSTGRNQRTGWIPIGIMHDLTDTQVDNIRGTFYDNAGVFTNAELFNALDRDVRSPQQFRDRLLFETSNRDQADVRTLFESYYYN